MRKIFSLVLAIILIILSLTACSNTLSKNIKAKNKNNTNINTKIIDINAAKTPVTLTMLCSWSADEAQKFADEIHKKFSHITIEYEACPIGAIPYNDEITRRVMHGTEPDIFITTDTNLWDSGKLLDLTNESFVSKYNLSLMKTLSGDGSVYFLPGLGDVLCYVYNAKWLDEIGLPPPQTDAELEEVFAAILESGKQPFIVPFSQMPTQYVKVLIAGYLSTPKGQQWVNDYNNGTTTMAQDKQWQRLWEHVEELTKKGYLRSEDLVYTENRRITAVQDKNSFMTTFSSSQYSKLTEDNKEQLKVLPLLGEKPEHQMVYSSPTGYFAVSNRLSAAENSAKRAAVVQVLDFISTKEGQEILRKSNPLVISYLSEVTLPIEDKYSNLAEIIQKGAYTQMPNFKRGVEPVLEEVFSKLVEGKITPDEAMKACDAQNANYSEKAVAPPPVIGTATEAFPWTYMQSRTEELAVINFCVDSVRKAAGTDYAIEIGTAFRGEFFEGNITSADVESVIRQDKKIYKLQVTGQQIWDIINQGVTPLAGSAWFIAPSGFGYSYQRLADGTGKLLEVTDVNNAPLDLQKSYTVAISENQTINISNTVNFSELEKQELPFTLREAVTANIKEQGKISPKLDGRIKIIK